MSRINGFIDIFNLLGLPKKEIFNLKELAIYLLKNDTVIIRKIRDNKQFIFSFEYNGETYFYKFDFLANPYNELIFYYIAKDLGINSLKYDLAMLGKFKGTISKNFKLKNARYISGRKILKNNHNCQDYVKYNTLEDIWIDLEQYYSNKPNMQQIVKKIMYDLVKVFIFDLLTGQEDRHCDNWGVVEYENGQIELQILLDNSRALIDHPLFVKSQMPLNQEYLFPEEMIAKFEQYSSEEFSSILPNYLWVISEENINKIFNKIEQQTNQLMPEILKAEYLEKFLIYYDFFEKLLNIPKNSR